MAQEDKKLLDLIENKIKEIDNRFKSYKKIDATLSFKTLSKTIMYLELANTALESGFVNDSCNEVDDTLNKNRVWN